MTPEVGTMSAILTAIGNIVTSAISWVGSFVTVVTGNPLILLFVIVAFVGLGVGLLSRLIRL